ncbi:MAG: hypothetical protein HY914_21365 [Desulfomonile tiedjei]|nr:hypothetical protein [Desulfomonile tiedjei]
MKCLKSSSQDLRELFDRNISVRYIAEYLTSFDGEASASQIHEFMAARDYDVVGVRRQGQVVGYVNRKDLTDGLLADHTIGFSESDLIDEADPLVEVFVSMRHSPRLFVRMLGQVGGIVTRGDLQKAPVRMWLFGLTTLVEMQLLRIIRDNYPNECWRKCLSEKRLNAAEQVLAERRQRNEAIDVVDCLQFCDKRDIILKNTELRKAIGIESAKAGDRLLSDLERLRNSLAHAQDIVADNLPRVVDLAEQAELLLLRCEQLCAEK